MSTAIEKTITTEITSIAEEIRVEHEACEQNAQSAVEHAIRAGELLIEAKAQVEHGGWLTWLRANFPASQQTANAYMRISEKYGRSRDLPMSVNAALKQLQPTKYICTKCNTERSASQFDPHGTYCNVCVREGMRKAIEAPPAVISEHTREEAADLFGVPVQSIIEAERIKREDPEKFEQIRAGEIELEVPIEPPKTFEIKTERGRKMAENAKQGLWSVLSSTVLEMAVKELQIPRALAAADDAEKKEMLENIEGQIRALRYLRDEIKRRVEQ